MVRKLLLPLLGMVLSGCSTYSSNFGCGDALGASCQPVSVVDQMIDNGKILELHHKKYRHKKCNTLLVPKLNDKEIPIEYITEIK